MSAGGDKQNFMEKSAQNPKAQQAENNKQCEIPKIA